MKRTSKTKGKSKAAVPNRIAAHFHCGECLKEFPGLTPYVKLISAGWTEEGLQVWCDRHNRNIIDVDFMGQKVGVK
jgi:hypothetical protein